MGYRLNGKQRKSATWVTISRTAATIFSTSFSCKRYGTRKRRKWTSHSGKASIDKEGRGEAKEEEPKEEEEKTKEKKKNDDDYNENKSKGSSDEQRQKEEKEK